MSPGQLLTFVTLGAAAVLGVTAIALAAVIYLSPAFYASVAPLSAQGERIPADWLAIMVAAGGLVAAVSLVKAQQALVAWRVRREIAKLTTMFREVEIALGTDKATEFMEFKVKQIISSAQRPTWDPFGGEEFVRMAKDAGFIDK